jgi:hypothetical protein
MKKMFLLMFVAAIAVGACGKKKDAAKPEDKTMTSPPPAGDQAAPPAGEGDKTAPPAAEPPK